MKTNLVKKEIAIKLRKKGKSIRDIENILGVARSTLSGWLYNVELTREQKERLHKKWLDALVKARLKAADVHRNGRLERVKRIKEDTAKFASKLTIDKTLGEIIFAIFYLAEGTKKECSVVIVNSNPKILKNILNLFRYLYSPKPSKFRCCLHLRMDQSEEQLKNYWSKILKIPKFQFIKTQFDKRTTKLTFKKYRGVCAVFYNDVNLQRRILYIGEELLQVMDKI